MHSTLRKAVETIVRVADPDKIILFGSHAAGASQPNSDIDLLVLKQGSSERRKLTQEIYLNFENIGAPVDVIVADLERFEKLKEDPYMIYAEAAKRGTVVYEKDETSK